MINTTNIEQAKKQINSELRREEAHSKARSSAAREDRVKKNPVIVQAQDYDFNRAILEYGRFDILLSPEAKTSKDTLKKINSGLDYILAETAAKKGISIGIDLEELRSLDKKTKARRLTKLIQNIKVCRKAKAKITLLNYKDKKDATAFLSTLGASSQQANSAVN